MLSRCVRALFAAMLALPLALALTLRAAVPPVRAADPLGAIAYAGTDGNIWTMQPDGSAKRQLTTSGTPQHPFYAPRWSPDGTMLTFGAMTKDSGGDVPDGIYLYRDGAARRLPGLADCEVPAFTSDGQRLALSCARHASTSTPPQTYSPQQLETDPALAAVSTSKLDGSDWRVFIPYVTKQASYSLCCGFGVYRIEFSPADGAVLLNIVAGTDGAKAVVLGDAAGHLNPPLPLYDAAYQRSQATFAPGGQDLLLTRCSGCGLGDRGPFSVGLVQVDRAGGHERVVLPGVATFPGFTSPSPEGQAVAFTGLVGNGPDTTIDVAAFPDGTPRAIADGSSPAWRPVPARQCFAETKHCVQGRFLQYWQAHGGLAINGYPISDEMTQTLEDGKPYTVQYFERVRMEYHPENAPPYDVELGQFGRRILAAVPGAPTAAVTPKDGYTSFPQTGHNVGAQFLAYWNTHGGLAQFGYPLTEAFPQQLEDGKTYTVQYFERARFEAHPENAPPYDVELGQFGRRILAEAGH